MSFDANGKLRGALNGEVWVYGGEGVHFEPLGCNGGTCAGHDAGRFCTRGTVPALSCIGSKCNWDDDWGIDIDLTPTKPQRPWGEGAATRVAVSFSGTPGRYILKAHVAGDPDEKPYAVANYRSGMTVSARDFRLEWWNDEESRRLDSFRKVDRFALSLESERTSLSFDICITGVNAEFAGAP